MTSQAKEKPSAVEAPIQQPIAEATSSQTRRAPGRPNARQAFASLGQRNYRLWFMGQSASMVGTWMQMTAQGFLVYQLTRSPAYLGYVGFANGIPLWLFTLYGGVISDRISRRKLLLITQTAMMVLAFILAALTFLNWVQPWHIIVLSFGLGIANAFDAPARQSFVVELVPREDLGNAIALTSMMVNLGTATGPAIAGVAYALLGPAWCFSINGISFLAVISALLMMRLKPIPPRPRTGSAFDEFKDGFRYVFSHPILRILIATATTATIFGLGYATLLPAWSVSILGGDSTTNGYLQSARGVGSLIGALTIASLGRVHYKGRLLTLGSLLFPVLLLLWSTVRWIPLSLLTLVGVGFGVMVMLNMTNTLVQSLVPDQLRGRVMSIYTLAFFGMFPVSSLIAGAAAEQFGAPLTVALGAALTLGYAIFLWLRVPQLRAME